MAYDKNLREEEVKNKVASDFFADFDCTQIVGNIDFCVTIKTEDEELFECESLLWAEAKRGTKADIYASFVQLILTIGRAKTYANKFPPPYLGAFDAEKIAFISYACVQDVFHQNDFNWNVTPSDHTTKEFVQLKNIISKELNDNSFLFYYDKDEQLLKRFIKKSIALSKNFAAQKISKTNYIHIYQNWLNQVKPHIDVDWEAMKEVKILDSDFYLADLFVDDQSTEDISDDKAIRDNLFVVFENKGYYISKENLHTMFDAKIMIKDEEAYRKFWRFYKRPPRKDMQEFIIERRDLLVPQDVRERKGSFFTPHRWVELSQQYLANVLGEDWQDEYYIWDCAAGTGNLLNGLSDKYKIYASTLDQADVNIMQERAKNGANLLESHIFQFDFLNDSFDKLPKGLKEIIDDEEKRKKLVIYINPPYAETMSYGKKSKEGLNQSLVNTKYISMMGIANRELFAQFFTRVVREIPGSILAEFSKLKILQGSNFKVFRENFPYKLEKLFIVPANTFDNVKGQFPIGFFIWNLKCLEPVEMILADVYNATGQFFDNKSIRVGVKAKTINDWLISTRVRGSSSNIGFMACLGNDFQQNKVNYIMSNKSQMASPRGSWITDKNLNEATIYLAVRHCIEATWLNDRDQFFYPKDGWQEDREFQGNCLAFTLFHGQNRIQSAEGINHWIPFTEAEVNAKDCFASHFMTDYIKGQISVAEPVEASEEGTAMGDLFDKASPLQDKLVAPKAMTFSPKAKAVFDAGRELWTYYHSQDFAPNTYNPNASLYDIRAYFQGFNEKGRMNSKSDDPEYTRLIGKLRARLKDLAKAIEPKVYEYEFLKS